MAEKYLQQPFSINAVPVPDSQDRPGFPAGILPAPRNQTLPHHTCYACGQEGHITQQCKLLQEFVNISAVKMDEQSGLFYADDSTPVTRNYEQTLVEAIRRQMVSKASAASNYIGEAQIMTLRNI